MGESDAEIEVGAQSLGHASRPFGRLGVGVEMGAQQKALLVLRRLLDRAGGRRRRRIDQTRDGLQVRVGKFGAVLPDANETDRSPDDRRADQPVRGGRLGDAGLVFAAAQRTQAHDLVAARDAAARPERQPVQKADGTDGAKNAGASERQADSGSRDDVGERRLRGRRAVGDGDQAVAESLQRFETRRSKPGLDTPEGGVEPIGNPFGGGLALGLDTVLHPAGKAAVVEAEDVQRFGGLPDRDFHRRISFARSR